MSPTAQTEAVDYTYDLGDIVAFQGTLYGIKGRGRSATDNAPTYALRPLQNGDVAPGRFVREDELGLA